MKGSKSGKKQQYHEEDHYQSHDSRDFPNRHGAIISSENTQANTFGNGSITELYARSCSHAGQIGQVERRAV